MPVDRFDHAGIAYDDLRDGPIQNIATYLAQAGNAGAPATVTRRTSLITATSGINTAETLLLAVPLVLPSTLSGISLAGTLNVGTVIRATFFGTTTDTVANTSTFTIRMGTLGTVAGDTSVATFVTSASGTTGTNVPFVARIELVVQTLTATGTAIGNLSVISPATGIIGAATAFDVQSAAAINALPTTTATFIDLSYLSAATTTTSTFQAGYVEVLP